MINTQNSKIQDTYLFDLVLTCFTAIHIWHLRQQGISCLPVVTWIDFTPAVNDSANNAVRNVLSVMFL